MNSIFTLLFKFFCFSFLKFSHKDEEEQAATQKRIMSAHLTQDVNISVWIADLCKFQVDAVVNAAIPCYNIVVGWHWRSQNVVGQKYRKRAIIT